MSNKSLYFKKKINRNKSKRDCESQLGVLKNKHCHIQFEEKEEWVRCIFEFNWYWILHSSCYRAIRPI